MTIRETNSGDLDDILAVESAAFDGDEALVQLVRNLLEDQSAQPSLSLLAIEEGQAVGHILFTHANIGETQASLLAPMAVVPGFQGRGIGGKLIEKGLSTLRESDRDLVFVLGYPAYYHRFGFKTAGQLGLHAPYEIPEDKADAWMVQALRSGVVGEVEGTVTCADAISKPEFWRE